MKNNPKVSIIIPVYNGSNFIDQALDSALAQTYKNIEIIVVNDGSNDKNATRKIVKKYATKNPNIKYFEKENGGVSTALNLAIKKMDGDYFSWLSHDDRYYPEKIEKQIEYMQNFDDMTILYSDYDLMDDNSNIFAKGIKNHEELMNKPEYSLLTGAINGITLLIPKKAFDDYGEFRVDLKCTQDYEMWLRMMETYTFIHQPEILATTRLHRDQTTNTSPLVVKEGDILWINIIEAFNKKQRIKLDNSEYEFLLKMREFMKTTPYNGALEYLEDKIAEIEEKTNKKLEKTLVSVVIPFYKRLDLLEESIKSVLNQTHKKWELILVNDGTKNVKQIQKYTEDKRIKLINLEQNQGVSHARNVGIENSKGEYIAFLDSDDLFFENKIENQLKYMLLRESEFCYTSYIRKNNETEETIIVGNELNIQRKIISNCTIATPTVMVKRSLLETNKIKYNEQIRYAEDACFYLEVLKHTSGFGYSEPLTQVNANTESSYLDNTKQITGLKNILKYIVNDDYYNTSTFDKELARLCFGFCTIVIGEEVKANIAAEQNEMKKEVIEMTDEQTPEVEINEVSNIQNEYPQNTRKLKRYLKALKKNGLIYCIKRVIAKVKYRLSIIGGKNGKN